MEKIKEKRELIALLDKINKYQDIKKEITNISSGLSQYFDLDEFYKLPFPVICKIIKKSYESPDVYKTIVARCSVSYPKESTNLFRYLPIVDMTFEQCISIIGSFSCSPICMKLKELHLEDLAAVNPDISYAISQIHKEISELKDMQKQALEKGKEKEEIPHEEDIHDFSLPPRISTPPPECTFLSTGRQFAPGDFYKCLTCGGPDSQAICPACAHVCHRGHNLQIYHGPYYCDCGSHDLFHCQLVHETLKCTFEETGRSYMTGEYYKCHTCGGPFSQAICPACAKVCHKGHNLQMCEGRYYCDCGAHDLFSCKLVNE